MKKEPKIVYQHIGDMMRINSTQEPRRVYDCLELGDNYEEVRFQCLLFTGAYTIFKTKEEVLKAYPHVKLKVE